MLSIGTITAGDGYKYLTKEVVSGAEDYYIRAGVGSGEAEGWWLGAQREAFGVSGGVVSEAQMAGFFGTKTDPATGEPLGSKFRVYATVAERLARAAANQKAWVEDDLAVRSAALQAAGVGEERWAESLAAHQVAAEERWNKTRQKIERAGERNSVAGYDLTFSAPKSVSVLWASAPEKDAQRTVRAAHHEGICAAMAVLERDGSFVRRGRNGVRQEQVSGVLAAAFDHRTSRSGDPQLHTHVAVLAMAKTGDRRVLALDGRAIYGLSGALSAIYDFHRDKALIRDLNVRLEVCERTGVREIAGVPDSLRALWSTRRAQITPRVEELKAQYLVTHGREAPPEMVAKMAQWATLDTRPAKGEPESTEALFARWRQAALAAVDTDLAQVWSAATGRKWLAPTTGQTEPDIVDTVMQRLETEKASWTVPNLVQVTWQVMERDPHRSAEEDQARAERCVAAVLAHPDVLKLTPSLGLDLPAELVRADGEAVYQVHYTDRFATRSAICEEQYLVARSQSATAIPVPAERIEAAIAGTVGTGLSNDQAAAVRGVLASRADVSVVIGPAGTGKTTTMAALASGWQANGGQVMGLALSQTAANELAAATGARAENIAKLLWETRRIDPKSFPGHAAQWGIARRALVIMDEAGMTDRAGMVAVARLCEAADAKLVLVGDHQQLESPEARGAMRLMARVGETFELAQVHRFAHEWERDASLRLRAGDVEVLDVYAAHGRIYGGTAEANETRAVRLALADHLAGRRVFILAGTNERAARVAGRFRDGLVAYKRVEADGVHLSDGNLAGVGDRIVTRVNERTITTSRGRFVTNRSVYQVLSRHRDGALTVGVVDPTTGFVDGDDSVTLPAGYVADNVVLEYAGTTHAAQGGTRFVSHALISERDTVNSVYVALTRGREANLAHVDSEVEAGQDSPASVRDPVAVLARVFSRDEPGDALSAVEARDLAIEQSKSLRSLFPIWQDLEGEHATATWRDRITHSQNAAFAARVTTAPAWPTLAARLHTIEAAGGDPEAALNAAIAARPLTDAADLAAVLHHRLGPQASAGEADPGLHLPFSLRPSGDSPYLPAMRQVAARIDQRVSELGERAAQNPPDWAARLGPVPTDTVGRAEWTDLAAIVASYREAFSIEGSDPIGPTPPPARPEARRWWSAAQAALTGKQLPTGWASDEDLAQRVAAGDRAETDRPALVDLAGASQAERDLQAELVYATENQWRARTDPTITPDDMAAARQRVHTTREVLQEAQEHLRAAEAGHQAYQQWETRTGTTRAEAQAARRELVRRNPPANAESRLAEQPTNWVAYQSVQADRYLATKGRALDSAREAVRRLTHRIHRHTEADETSQADRLRDPLQRNQADVARLEEEVTAATEDAAKYNEELAGRPDGQQAKIDASPRPRGWKASPVTENQQHQPPAPNPRQRPPRPTH